MNGAPASRRAWAAALFVVTVLHAAALYGAVHWMAISARPPLVAPPPILIDLTPIAASQPPRPEMPVNQARRSVAPRPSAPPPLPMSDAPVVTPEPPPDLTPVEAPEAHAAPGARVTVPEDWTAQVLRRLARFQRYPERARSRRAEGVAHVRFVLDRTGAVNGVRLDRSTGDADLDAEAVALITRAAPLPRLPASIGAASVEMVVPIEFYLRR